MVSRWAAKLAMLFATGFAMLSQGGLLVAAYPVLVFGHRWVARRASTPERFGWIILSSTAGYLWMWQATYGWTDGERPTVWIVSAAGAVIIAVVLIVTTHPDRSSSSSASTAQQEPATRLW